MADESAPMFDERSESFERDDEEAQTKSGGVEAQLSGDPNPGSLRAAAAAFTLLALAGVVIGGRMLSPPDRATTAEAVSVVEGYTSGVMIGDNEWDDLTALEDKTFMIPEDCDTFADLSLEQCAEKALEGDMMASFMFQYSLSEKVCMVKKACIHPENLKMEKTNEKFHLYLLPTPMQPPAWGQPCPDTPKDKTEVLAKGKKCADGDKLAPKKATASIMECEALCAAEPKCNYFTRYTRQGGCVLWESCEKTQKANGDTYKSVKE